MAEVLVIFGSKSDEQDYKRLLAALEEKEIQYYFRIASAHKSPEELKEVVLYSDAKIIIAGAGLNAALPGVVAAISLVPVIGMPCTANYGGLDAMLAITQMPPGVPVLAVPPGEIGASIAAASARKMLQPAIGSVKILMHSDSRAVKKAVDSTRKILGEFKIAYTIHQIEKSKAGDFKERDIILHFSEIPDLQLIPSERLSPDLVTAQKGLHLAVPVAEQSAPEQALDMFYASKRSISLWLGLNNGTNAALAVARIANCSGLFTEKLKAYREEIRQQAVKADKEERRG